MKKLSYYLRKYAFVYIGAVIALIIYEALDMVAPFVTQSIIDDVIGAGMVEKLTGLLIVLVAVGLGRVLFGYIREFTFDKISFRVASDIRKDLLSHIQKLSVDYFDRTNTGEVMARVKDDVDHIQAAFGFIGMLALQIVFHTAIILFCMFRLSPKLTIFPLIALPICGALAIIMEKKLDNVYEEISDENSEMNTVAEENLAGVRTVKAFAREKYEIAKFLTHNKKYYELNMKQSKVWIKYNPVFSFITKLLPLSAVIWGGIMVINDEMTLGTLGAFVEYCGNAVWPMEMLGWISNEIASSIASKKKIDRIYNEVPAIKNAEGITETDGEVERANGDITFEKVSLTIENKKILDDVSFELKAGHTLGIMGATGAGKTSIINMLLRFYDPESGTVRLDGEDIKEMPLNKLRKNIATVMQDVFLFSDTISENVKLGKKNEVSEETINAALQKAAAEDFIGKLSDGVETLIGERGVGLSGGQKQRISMARAFAKNAPVLVLDDSTSALDSETEYSIQQTLRELKDVTKIIVAHRISSVRHADEIIVLENGAVIEKGTHDELLAKKGYYYRTYEAQYGDIAKAV